MELSKKVHTAIDETRILILGAQILLGFQLRSVFQDGYDALPHHSRNLDGLSLAFLVIAVGLLIAPGLYHRIAEGGDDSGHLHQVVTTIADIALFPFAVALGIAVFLTGERVFGSLGGVAAGVAAGGAALLMWYGFPRLERARVGQRERNMTAQQSGERQETPLPEKIQQMLIEARVILPGAQALLGFQLAIVLMQSFEKLPDASRYVHAASLIAVAIAVMLLMAPAAYHRIVYAGEAAEGMHRVGSILITAATVPLALGLAGDVYVVIGKIGGAQAGVIAAGLSAALLAALWYAYPVAAAYSRRTGRRR